MWLKVDSEKNYGVLGVMTRAMKRVGVFGVIIAALLISSFVISNSQEDMSGVFNTRNGVFIDGYDVVSYFTGAPSKGSKEYQVKYMEVDFYFASQANKDTFNNNPEKYIPAYGGWCAFAIGETAEKVNVNTKTFKIIKGKNYLFYNKLLTNTLELWNADEDELFKMAEANWPLVKEQ